MVCGTRLAYSPKSFCTKQERKQNLLTIIPPSHYARRYLCYFIGNDGRAIHRLLLTHSPVIPLTAGCVYVGKLHKQSLYGSLCAYTYTFFMLIGNSRKLLRTQYRISCKSRREKYLVARKKKSAWHARFVTLPQVHTVCCLITLEVGR